MELPAAFSQRIKSTPLTAKEALVAEYILNNFLSVCYVSTSELARILGVSDATVSRTSKVLGYRSFLDLQKEIQSFVSQKADYAQRGFFPPIERLHTHQSLDAKENIVAVFHPYLQEPTERFGKKLRRIHPCGGGSALLLPHQIYCRAPAHRTYC